MAIHAEYKESGNFVLTPPGQYQGVCCELVDLGHTTKVYKNAQTGADEPKNVHEVQFYFQLNKVDPESGKRYEVRTKALNLVLSEKSNLKAFLLAWRGHDLLPEELKPPGVLLDALVGRNAIINVVHAKVGEKTYANIGSIMPVMEGMAEITPLNYEPKQEAETAKRATAVANGAQPSPAAPAVQQSTVNADGIPF